MPLFPIYIVSSSKSSHVFFVFIIRRLFVPADPFHEVKRKRDKKKEVYVCCLGKFSV